MEELFKKLFGFFENEKVSISRKVAIPLLFLLIILSLNDICGISYYIIGGMKADYIIKIEDAKMKCKSDSLAQLYLDNMMNETLYRRNVFQWFASLFENASIGKTKEIDYADPESGVLYKKIEQSFPTVQRNQLWHTITSSLFGIVGLCLMFYVIMYVIFGKGRSQNKTTTFLRFIIVIITLIFIIWLTQWLFGLIPVIADRAYINYIIQGLINVIAIGVVFWKLK